MTASGLLGDLLIGIDHVAICLAAPDPSVWSRLLGLPVHGSERLSEQLTEVAFLDLPGNSPPSIELVSPLEGNQGLARFLEKRGEGLHHIAFAVKDVRAALERLRQAGVALIDQQPRPGAHGHLVAFLHPRAANGVLVELVEKTE
ncbi:MAG: VOC family protein [Pseudomonadota bacterium]